MKNTRILSSALAAELEGKDKSIEVKLNMMMNMELEEIRNIVAPLLKRYNVKRAAIFDSYVRGEQKEDSDLDILVEFEGKKSLLDLAGLKIKLGSLGEKS